MGITYHYANLTKREWFPLMRSAGVLSSMV